MAKKKTRYQRIQEKLRKQKKRARKKGEKGSQGLNLGPSSRAATRKKRPAGLPCPTVETSKTKLRRKLPGAVKNALEIAIRLGTEKIMSHEDVLPSLQVEFGSELGKEAFITWDQTEKSIPQKL